MPYIALTAGPIYTTLQKARKPKEIWAASYIFSWIMRELLSRMGKSGFDILSPYYRILADEEKFGAGLIPDRIFCLGDESKLDALQTLVANVIADFSEAVAERIGADKEEIKHYFKEYFRFYSLLWEDEDGTNEDVLGQLNQYLNILELQPTTIRTEMPYFQGIFKRINNSFLVKDAYGISHPIMEDNGRFPSLPEFAAAGLKRVDSNEKFNRFDSIKQSIFYKNETSSDEDELIKVLKGLFPEEFRAYHRYIAIVKADGDSFGKAMAAIGNRLLPEDPNTPFGLLKFFDKCLFEFGVKAAKAIHNFGGNPVYIGGDDLLFFAPIATQDDNIFNLCDDLNRCFEKEVVEKLNEKEAGIAPTLSFGIHICYAKFPLYEALKEADEQLNLAKNKAVHPHKNAVAFSLRKHSGAIIQTAFSKNPGVSWAAFRDLINVQTNGEATEYFNSIAHKLDLIGRLMDDPNTNSKRLEAFFQNQFNEDIHRKNEGFTQRLQAFILALKNEYAGVSPILPKIKSARQLSAPMEKLYAALRFIQFINSKDDKNDRILD